MNRVYLDYNATTPLRPEAKSAMVAAMDAVWLSFSALRVKVWLSVMALHYVSPGVP